MIKEPTLEQLDRIFFLYAKMMLESFGKDKPMSYEERDKYIINHWNDDEEENTKQNTTDYVEESVSWFKNNWREYINVDADGVVVFGHWENDFREYMDSKNKGNYIP